MQRRRFFENVGAFSGVCLGLPAFGQGLNQSGFSYTESGLFRDNCGNISYAEGCQVGQLPDDDTVLKNIVVKVGDEVGDTTFEQHDGFLILPISYQKLALTFCIFKENSFYFLNYFPSNHKLDLTSVIPVAFDDDVDPQNSFSQDDVLLFQLDPRNTDFSGIFAFHNVHKNSLKFFGVRLDGDAKTSKFTLLSETTDQFLFEQNLEYFLQAEANLIPDLDNVFLYFKPGFGVEVYHFDPENGLSLVEIIQNGSFLSTAHDFEFSLPFHFSGYDFLQNSDDEQRDDFLGVIRCNGCPALLFFSQKRGQLYGVSFGNSTYGVQARLGFCSAENIMMSFFINDFIFLDSENAQHDSLLYVDHENKVLKMFAFSEAKNGFDLRSYDVETNGMLPNIFQSLGVFYRNHRSVFSQNLAGDSAKSPKHRCFYAALPVGNADDWVPEQSDCSILQLDFSMSDAGYRCDVVETFALNRPKPVAPMLGAALPGVSSVLSVPKFVMRVTGRCASMAYSCTVQPVVSVMRFSFGLLGKIYSGVEYMSAIYMNSEIQSAVADVKVPELVKTILPDANLFKCSGLKKSIRKDSLFSWLRIKDLKLSDYVYQIAGKTYLFLVQEQYDFLERQYKNILKRCNLKFETNIFIKWLQKKAGTDFQLVCVQNRKGSLVYDRGSDLNESYADYQKNPQESTYAEFLDTRFKQVEEVWKKETSSFHERKQELFATAVAYLWSEKNRLARIQATYFHLASDERVKSCVEPYVNRLEEHLSNITKLSLSWTR